MSVRRGVIMLVDFDPARRTEAAKVRPAVVVTNDAANAHGTSVVVVPLTSNIATVYPFQVLVPAASSGLDRDAKAQVELVRSVSRTRIGCKVGALPDDLLALLDTRLRLHLGLE